MSWGVKEQTATYYSIFAVGLSLGLSLLGLFLTRLHIPLIKVRGWEFSTVQAFCGLFHFSVLALELAITADPNKHISCHVLLWPSILFVPMFFMPFLFRGFYLLFRSRSQWEKANNRLSGWFNKNRHLTSLRLNLGLYLGISLTFLIIGVIVQYSSPNPEPFITTNKCVSKQVYMVVVQACLCILATILLVIRLWHVSDTFAIKEELRFGLAVNTPPAILWALFFMTSVFPQGVKSSWFVMLSILAGLLTSIVFPTIKSYTRAARIAALLRSSPSNFSLNEKDQLRESVLNPDIFPALQDYCQRSWCVENVLFYREVLHFQEAFPDQSEEKRAERAQHIYDQFLKPDSPLEVNVDMQSRERVLEDISAQHITEQLFDEVSKTVIIMLKHGVFREWLLSNDFASKAISYRKSTELSLSASRFSSLE